MAKGKLSDAVKTYIVQALACFDTPSTVEKAVRAEFGETITRQAIEAYDPNKKAGAALSDRWKQLFAETRKTFLEDTATIAISHRAVRLRALQRMSEKAEQQGNMVLAAALMRQAAEEVGGSLTNRRELTGKDGKDLPVPVSPVTTFQLPDNGRG